MPTPLVDDLNNDDDLSTACRTALALETIAGSLTRLVQLAYEIRAEQAREQERKQRPARIVKVGQAKYYRQAEEEAAGRGEVPGLRRSYENVESPIARALARKKE